MLHHLRHQLQHADKDLLVLEEDAQEVIQKRFVGGGEHQCHPGRIEMEAFAADLGLTFQAREIEVGKLLKPGVFSRHDQAFHRLRQQILMVEGDEGTFILERKNDPYSHVN